MKMIKLSFIVLGALLLAACGTTSPELKAFHPEMNDQQLMTHGEVALAHHDFREASQYFDALSSSERFAQTAALYSIYADYGNTDYPAIAADTDLYIRNYSVPAYGESNADHDQKMAYVYYMQGVANFNMHLGFLQRYLPADYARRDMDSWQKAFLDFSMVVTDYAPNPYEADARQHMIYIRNMLGEHEYKIARYYYRRGDYLAAVGRAKEVVEQYQGSDAVEGSLVILVQSYAKLGLTKQEADAKKLLFTNFPNAKI